MDKRIYDIWLQQALGYNNHKIKTIYEIYKSTQAFYESSEYEWRLSGCLSNSQIKRLQETSIDIAKNIFELSMKLGYDILTLSDPNYPPLLLELSNPPVLIYANGDISCLNSQLTVSIVGTRNPTMYGLEMARELSQKIASSGGMVVSGGALGIDTAAHKGALNVGGKTIAVLGCGINYPYLSTNRQLRHRISKSGVLISEYPPNYPVHSYNFPLRNRIISGLSLGTIVIEAGKDSGSLITANLANEQNRDVFVVPVDMRSPLSVGTISLINDGAKVVVNVSDIINEYKFKLKNKSFDKKYHFKHNYSHTYKEEKPEPVQKSSQIQNIEISQKAKIIYDLLENKKMHVNDICENSGLIISEVLAALTELEIYGLVRNFKGREYERISVGY